MLDGFTRLHALFVFICPIYPFNENKKRQRHCMNLKFNVIEFLTGFIKLNTDLEQILNEGILYQPF